MARTGDPNSATAQFFINVEDNDFLDYAAPTRDGYGYTVFGKVVEGMDVVDKIEGRPPATRAARRTCRAKPVIIESRHDRRSKPTSDNEPP